MRKSRRRIVWGFIVLGAVVLGASWIGPMRAATPPERVNYQGVLRDATDHPRSGPHDMVFRIWTDPVAGVEVLVDSHQAAGSGPVVVSGGLFNVAIGSGIVTDGSGPGTYTSIGDAFRDHGALFLEVSVMGETLLPRVPVHSVPYSLHASALDGRGAADFLDVSTTPQTKTGPVTFGATVTVSPASPTISAIVVTSGDVAIGRATAEAKLDVAGTIRTDSQLVVTAPEGTPPFSVASTTRVENLNADTVDGLSGPDIVTVSATPQRKDGALTLGGSLTIDLSPATATALVVRTGNVGIGTLDPVTTLDVRAAPSTGAEDVLHVGVADASGALVIGNDSPEVGVFAPRITGLGSVTMTALTVAGTVEIDTGTEPVLKFELSDSTGDTVDVRPLFRISNHDQPQLTLDATGQLGLGTTTPGAKLDVAGGSIRTDSPLVVTVAAGVSPLAVTTTARVDNFNADLLDGVSVESLAPALHAHQEYINRAGDTMTGTLSLPDNGLQVGTNEPQLTIASGNVGIGRPPSPNARLTVQAAPSAGAEQLLDLGVADAPGRLVIDNGSPEVGVFAPRVSGYGGVTVTAVTVAGTVEVDAGSEPAVMIEVANSQGTRVDVRPLFQVRNQTQPEMTLGAAGQLGLGTATPATKLDVVGTIRTDSPLVVTVAAGVSPLAVTTTARVDNFNADLLDGVSVESLAPALHAHQEYINRAGDTMTGMLHLPDDGLTIGSTQPQLTIAGGNVAIGPAPPIFDLQVEGDSGAAFHNFLSNSSAVIAGGGAGGPESPSYGVEAHGRSLATGGGGGGGFFQDDRTGNFASVAQNFSKIVGPGNVSFVQNHPYEKDKVIVYVAPEGDESAVYTRGTARLVDGEARVALGESFQWVANPDIGLTAYVTPRREAVPLAVVSLNPQEMLVRAPVGGPRDVVFDYIVYGLRIGFEETGVVEKKTREAYIPSMAHQRAQYDEHPELRAFNALERFKEQDRAAHGTEAASFGRAAALKAAIGEFDPAVHGATSGQTEGWPGPFDAGAPTPPVAPAPVDAGAGTPGRPAPAPGTWPTSPEAARGDGQDAYARSFRPSAPDLAAYVAVSEPVATGDVLVADRLNPGVMKPADSAGDPAVVGIVSGDPGVALGADRARIGEADRLLAQQLEAARSRGDEAEAARLWSALEERFRSTKAPVAFTGIVACKVDASHGAIQVGDLLTTSPTRGHAMRADHPSPGTILGKALEALPEGTGLIKVLAMLR